MLSYSVYYGAGGFISVRSKHLERFYAWDVELSAASAFTAEEMARKEPPLESSN